MPYEAKFNLIQMDCEHNINSVCKVVTKVEWWISVETPGSKSAVENLTYQVPLMAPEGTLGLRYIHAGYIPKKEYICMTTLIDC